MLKKTFSPRAPVACVLALPVATPCGPFQHKPASQRRTAPWLQTRRRHVPKMIVKMERPMDLDLTD